MSEQRNIEKDRERLVELRRQVSGLWPMSTKAVEIRNEMGSITESYESHTEVIADWDEYCNCDECMDLI